MGRRNRRPRAYRGVDVGRMSPDRGHDTLRIDVDTQAEFWQDYSLYSTHGKSRTPVIRPRAARLLFWGLMPPVNHHVSDLNSQLRHGVSVLAKPWHSARKPGQTYNGWQYVNHIKYVPKYALRIWPVYIVSLLPGAALAGLAIKAVLPEGNSQTRTEQTTQQPTDLEKETGGGAQGGEQQQGKVLVGDPSASSSSVPSTAANTPPTTAVQNLNVTFPWVSSNKKWICQGPEQEIMIREEDKYGDKYSPLMAINRTTGLGTNDQQLFKDFNLQFNKDPLRVFPEDPPEWRVPAPGATFKIAGNCALNAAVQSSKPQQ